MEDELYSNLHSDDPIEQAEELLLRLEGERHRQELADALSHELAKKVNDIQEAYAVVFAKYFAATFPGEPTAELAMRLWSITTLGILVGYHEGIKSAK